MKFKEKKNLHRMFKDVVIANMYRYLAFLASLCTCDGEAVRPTQDLIIDLLLEKKPELLIKTQVCIISLLDCNIY